MRSPLSIKCPSGSVGAVALARCTKRGFHHAINFQHRILLLSQVFLKGYSSRFAEHPKDDFFYLMRTRADGFQVLTLRVREKYHVESRACIIINYYLLMYKIRGTIFVNELQGAKRLGVAVLAESQLWVSQQPDENVIILRSDKTEQNVWYYPHLGNYTRFFLCGEGVIIVANEREVSRRENFIEAIKPGIFLAFTLWKNVCVCSAQTFLIFFSDRWVCVCQVKGLKRCHLGVFYWPTQNVRLKFLNEKIIVGM